MSKKGEGKREKGIQLRIAGGFRFACHPDHIWARVVERISKKIPVYIFQGETRSCQQVFHLEAEDAVQLNRPGLPAVNHPAIGGERFPGRGANGGLRGRLIGPGAAGADLATRPVPLASSSKPSARLRTSDARLR